MKHTQITSNVVRELFSKELTKCLVTVDVPYQYIREDNTIDVKKMGKISININGKFSLRQANKITIAMIGLANGELKSDVLVLPLDESPSPSFYLSTRTDVKSARIGKHKNRFGSNIRIHTRATKSQGGINGSIVHSCKYAKQNPINSILYCTREMQEHNGIHRIDGLMVTLDESPSPFLVNEYHKSDRIDRMTFELGCLNHLIDDEGNCFDKHEIESLTKIRDNLELNISGESPSPFLSSCKMYDVGGESE